jgi:uncharacterized protein
MNWNPPSPAEIESVVRNAKTIAVVGVSNKPDRASFEVAQYLIDCGDYEVFLVNPLYSEILGKRVYSKLEDIPQKIDIVDVFRKNSDLEPVFDSALKIAAKNIWLQLGISDELLAQKAQKMGIGVIMDRCLKVDHAFFSSK